MEKWCDDWRNKLEKLDDACHTRLCECRNNRNDIVKIASLMHCYNEERTKEECLERTLEWLGDWNGQFELTDLTVTEYTKILNRII